VTAEGLDISHAAMAACQEITRRFHNAQPGDEECARQATANAMAQVHQAEAAAARGK
jgi:hypothetical protein